ncbi:MAG: DUF2341 domain-containing protein, partial [Atribacterota bacterium]
MSDVNSHLYGSQSQRVFSALLILIMLLELVGSLFLFPIQEVQAADWYNSNWGYRREITVITDPAAATPADYQVLVTLTTDDMGNPYTNVNADGSDIFFTNTNGTSPIDYWIESWDNEGDSEVWVEVPDAIDANSSKIIYMYYGNPSASSASNGTNTFMLFDLKFDGPIGGVSSLGGVGHTCALLNNGNITCWGDNSDGQSEDYTSGDAVGVAAGWWHTCALLNNGNIDCWGYNSSGQAADYTSGDAVGVATGGYHTCALLNNGNIDCWGYNGDGQSENYTSGDAVGVAAGGEHNCALLNNGNIDCWGYNSSGQAENYTSGDAVGVAAGYWHTCA